MTCDPYLSLFIPMCSPSLLRAVGIYSRTNQQFWSLCITITITRIKLSVMLIKNFQSETKFPLKRLYVVSNRTAVAAAGTLSSVRFHPHCFDIIRMLKVEATRLPAESNPVSQ